jgi:hypothetical protein
MRIRSHAQLAARTLVTTVVALLVSPYGLAQTPAAKSSVNLVEPPPPLLPKQFGPWQQITDAAAEPSSDATTDAILKEDGLTRSSEATFKRESSSDTLRINAWQFVDATGAFSAFTFYRRPDDRPINAVKLGTSAVERNSIVLIWDGTVVVSAEFKGMAHPGELTDLAAALPKVGGPKGLAPLLPTFPLSKGLESESLKYALGPLGYRAMGGVLPPDLVGFDKSAETVTAQYAGEGTLTLLLYPTPQIAAEHGRQIESEMNAEAGRDRKSVGTVKLRREGPLVLLTTGPWKAAEAQRIVDNIHLHNELTWNKQMPPEFHTEVLKTASLLVRVLELSGLLGLAALVVAFFFGGGRALIRVLQGKPAATEPEFLSINLREHPGDEGSFKPLH